MQINDDYYEDLTYETTHQLLNAFREAGKATDPSKVKIPPPGPMSGRESCENSAGLTTLKNPKWDPSVVRKDL